MAPRVNRAAATVVVDTRARQSENGPLSSAEGYPSGQRGQTVNLLVYTFVGSNPTPSSNIGWLAGGYGEPPRNRPRTDFSRPPGLPHLAGGVARGLFRAGNLRTLRAPGLQCAAEPTQQQVAHRNGKRRRATAQMLLPGADGSVRIAVSNRAGGCSSMVEPQPSKLMTWVRFPSPAPDVSPSAGDVCESSDRYM